jgi:hypothetical protein
MPAFDADADPVGATVTPSDVSAAAAPGSSATVVAPR